MFTPTSPKINRDPNMIHVRIERATEQIEDPVFERLTGKWPILAAKLLNLYGLKACYGEEEQPYIKNAYNIFGSAVEKNVPQGKQEDLSSWVRRILTEAYPTAGDEFSYIDRKRAEHYAQHSTFLQLAVAVIPTDEPQAQAKVTDITPCTAFVDSHRATIDLLHQHCALPPELTKEFLPEDEYVD